MIGCIGRGARTIWLSRWLPTYAWRNFFGPCVFVVSFHPIKFAGMFLPEEVQKEFLWMKPSLVSCDSNFVD